MEAWKLALNKIEIEARKEKLFIGREKSSLRLFECSRGDFALEVPRATRGKKSAKFWFSFDPNIIDVSLKVEFHPPGKGRVSSLSDTSMNVYKPCWSVLIEDNRSDKDFLVEKVIKHIALEAKKDEDLSSSDQVKRTELALNGSSDVEDTFVMRSIKSRRGQPAFRKALFQVFEGKCCISGSAVSDVLEAAHIVPHAENSNYSLDNGLLLRADLHTLFDLDILRITGDGVVKISDDLRGSEYEKYEGVRVAAQVSSLMASNLKVRYEQCTAEGFD